MQVEHILIPAMEVSSIGRRWLELAEAATLCEMAFPLTWCTITKHYLVEILEPKRGRVAKIGMAALSNMAPVERWNKFLRALLKAHKNMELTVMRRYVDFLMVTAQRLLAPLGYFVLDPEKSTAVSAAGGYGENVGGFTPAYLSPHWRLTGRCYDYVLGDLERKKYHSWCRRNVPAYDTAHQGFLSTCYFPR